jgi:hypothetical protein
LEQIESAPLPRTSGSSPELCAALDEFFERGLARPRDQRFQSAQELSDDLSALAACHTQAPAERFSGITGSASADQALGRTGETRPLEAALYTRGVAGSRPTRSLGVAAATLAVAVGATLGLYFWVIRGAAGNESSTSELEAKAAPEQRPAIRMPATNETSERVAPAALAPSSTANQGASRGSAGTASPRPPPRRHVARRTSEPEIAPADSRPGSAAESAPPAVVQELDPVFGLQR